MSDKYTKFKQYILKLNEPRKSSIKNSLGVYDAYKFIRKNNWFDIGRPLKEHEFYQIIRRINSYLAEELLKGNDIIFPLSLGRLELRKCNSKPIIDDNGNIKVRYPIDWNRTIKLWYEDEESFTNKTLVRIPEKEVYKVIYNKSNAHYINQTFMSFKVNRDLKRRLTNLIRNNKIDAFSLW